MNCHCGRRKEKPHCPFADCGSHVVYVFALRRDTVTREDGSVVDVRVFRCRRCARIFNDDDWRLRCNAPWLKAVARVVLKDAKPDEPSSQGTPLERQMKIAEKGFSKEMLKQLEKVAELQRQRLGESE